MKHLSYSYYCIGAGHVASGMPVQDRATHCDITLSDGRSCTLLALSDGHGSKAHFRSDIGAQFAIEATMETLPHLLERILPLVSRQSLEVHRGMAKQSCNTQADHTERDTLLEVEFRRYFARLNALWCSKVMEHRQANPIDGEIDTYGARPYGCTVLGAAVLSGFWLAFQLGDGLCATLDKDGRTVFPIPDDSRCFMNRTTSMCIHNAADFRYCYSTKPIAALLLSSDGLENCYSEREEFASAFMLPIFEEIGDKGIDAAIEDITHSLPILSAENSRDDMSLALWTDEGSLAELSQHLKAMSQCCRRADLQQAMTELNQCCSEIIKINEDIDRLSLDDNEPELVRKKSSLATLEREEAHLRETIARLSSLIEDSENYKLP